MLYTYVSQQSLQRIKIVSCYILVLSSYVSCFSFYFSLLSCRFFLILFSIVDFFFCQYYTLRPLSFFNFLFQRYFCHVPHFFHYFIIFICFFHFPLDQFLIFLIIQPFYQDTHFSRTFPFLVVDILIQRSEFIFEFAFSSRFFFFLSRCFAIFLSR